MHQTDSKEISYKEIIIEFISITIILIIMIVIIKLFLNFRRYVSLNLFDYWYLLKGYLLDYFVD